MLTIKPHIWRQLSAERWTRLERMVERRNAGMTFAAIGGEVGLSRQRVERCIAHYTEQAPLEVVKPVTQLHPFVQGLLLTLPEPASYWSKDDRQMWLDTAASVFALMYTDKDD